MRKLNERSLAKLRQEEAAARKRVVTAWPLKRLALALYGTACSGQCGTTQPERLFIAPVDALLDAGTRVLVRGREYRLGAVHLRGLHQWIIDHDAPTSHAVFCWACFKRLGRARRRVEGIVHWRSPKAVEGFNSRR